MHLSGNPSLLLHLFPPSAQKKQRASVWERERCVLASQLEEKLSTLNVWMSHLMSVLTSAPPLDATEGPCVCVPSSLPSRLAVCASKDARDRVCSYARFHAWVWPRCLYTACTAVGLHELWRFWGSKGYSTLTDPHGQVKHKDLYKRRQITTSTKIWSFTEPDQVVSLEPALLRVQHNQETHHYNRRV